MNSGFELGLIYEKGVYVNKDNNLAFEYIKTAAEGGHHRAMAVLSSYYANGVGVVKNNVDSLMWFKIYNHYNKEKDGPRQIEKNMSNFQLQLASNRANAWISEHKEIK